jgi:LuxR family maltose regulon positive regulatory protein
MRGRSHLTAGEVNWAEAQLLSLDPSNLLLDDSVTRFVRMSMLGEVYHQQGRLHLAAAIYQPLLDLVDEQPLDVLLFHFFDRLCLLYYEWNQLAKARQYYRWCLSTIEQYRLPPSWSLSSLIGLAWILWAEGMSHAANQQLHKAAMLAQHTQQPGLTEQINIQRARFRLYEGNLGGAARLFKGMGRCLEGACDYQHQAAQLTLARLQIRQKQPERALRLLEVHEQMAFKAGRESDLIEILVLQALAYASQADSANASAVLANALCRAEREGFVRTFVDEGVEMMALLQQSAAQGITLLYAHDLLAAFSTKIAQPTKTLQTDRLVESLSRREVDVLRLVAAGLSNDEIAGQLTISPATVKKHLGNILGKLHVKNRTQAAARARELALI